jgi:pentatricopeptide repeat protein
MTMQVLRLCGSLAKQNLKPNEVTYERLMEAFAVHGMLQSCEELMEDMAQVGITPNLAHWHWLLKVRLLLLWIIRTLSDPPTRPQSFAIVPLTGSSIACPRQESTAPP